MIHQGDCIQVLAEMEANSVDAVVTDPPYGLEFMGKGWDAPWKKGSGLGGNTAGMGKVEMADGATRQKLPSYHGSPNPTCRNCGGLQRGKPGKKSQQPCQCDAPRFDDMIGPRQHAFQAWCTEWGTEALRVTKPGGYLLAFGGTRTHHRLVCGLEDAGWIIRDELQWNYLQGFPKGRANLKPAHEPIVLARKPGPLRHLEIERCRIPSSLAGSVPSRTTSTALSAGSQSSLGEPESATNSAPEHVLKLPVDSATSTDTSRPDIGCLPGMTGDGSATSGSTGRSGKTPAGQSPRATSSTTSTRTGSTTDSKTLPASPLASTPASTRPSVPSTPSGLETTEHDPSETWSDESENSNGSSPDAPAGRWPSNVLVLQEDAAFYDEANPYVVGSGAGDEGIGVSRVFYVPKADRADREPVLRGQVEPTLGKIGNHGNLSAGDDLSKKLGANVPRENSHATVKPTDLMRHLVRLVTPPGGTVLDCFAGSGSTLVACELEGFPWIGIEQSEEYVRIIEARLNGTQRGLGLDVPAPTRKQAKLGKDKGGGTNCSFFPGKCEGHPGHGRYSPTIHANPREEPAA